MIGFVLWAVLFAAMAALEGLSLTLGGHAWPSLSDLLRAATRPVFGRWLMLGLWLWLGWHMFMRGWSFFLRGAGAREPVKGPRGGRSNGEILGQVVLPLVVLYAAILAMLVAGWRARRSSTAFQSVRHAAIEIFRNPRKFVRYTAVTFVATYVLFVATMACYEFIVGRSAAGLVRDALTGGAFIAFGLALPVFVIASLLVAGLQHRGSRGRNRR